MWELDLISDLPITAFNLLLFT